MARSGVTSVLLFVAAAGVAAAQDPDDPAPPADVLGAPAAFGPEAAAEPRAEVPEGARLHESPDARSPSLATVDSPSELPVIERSGDWMRVRYGGLVGWVRTAGEGAATIPARSGAADALRREEVLAVVAERFPPPAADPVRLGAWPVYTDVDDPAILDSLRRAVAGLPDLYRQRYGLDPGTIDGEAIVLFAQEEGYRDFAREQAGLLGLGEGGHAGRGVASLYAGDRDRGELTSLLVHELTHLLNARTLGGRTPPWLEEGTANDLGFSRTGRDGRLEPGTIGGSERREASYDASRNLVVRTSWEGARGSLVGLGRRLRRGEVPSLEIVTQMPWSDLVDPENRSLLYAQSTFFVRYLLDREPDAFRGYLRHLAAGGTDDPAILAEALGRDWAQIDEGFRRWVLERVAELGLADAL